MSDFLLDSGGDLDFTNGSMRMTNDSSLSLLVKTRQRIRQRLGMFLGEWFLDRSRGVPYHEQVFVKNPNPVVLDAVFKSEILAEPDITQLRGFALDLDTSTRQLTVEFKAVASGEEFDFRETFGL